MCHMCLSKSAAVHVAKQQLLRHQPRGFVQHQQARRYWSTLQPVLQHQQGCLQAPVKKLVKSGRPNSCERTFCDLDLTSVGKTITSTSPCLRWFIHVYTTHLWWFWGWFMALFYSNHIRSESRQVETIQQSGLTWFDQSTWTSWSDTRWQVIQ